MAGARQGPPQGYRERAMGGTLVVAREGQLDAVCAALRCGSLHTWASLQPGAQAMQGRTVAWAARLPTGLDVVVRHSRHGGMLAGFTRDLFLAPTRAPMELAIASRLRDAGVRTPEVIAYAVYPALGPWCRADVVTARIDGVDLPTALRERTGPDERHAIQIAVSRLLEALRRAGATHADLNARNILIANDDAHTAYVLDVDRVTFTRGGPERPEGAMANSVRLLRSLAKLQKQDGLEVTPHEIRALTQCTGCERPAGTEQ